MKELLLLLNPIVRSFAFPKHPERLATVVELQGWEKAKENPEVRALLQRFGTQVGRQGLGEDVWIGALAKSTKGFYADRKIVIPDIRFTNESDFIRKQMRGEVWGVDRPDFDNGLGANGTHESERDIPLLLHAADYTFINAAPSLAAFQAVVLRGIRNRMAVVKEPKAPPMMDDDARWGRGESQ
jgi:hypothetical protein